ncbi:MAG TPA: divergent polysaccharide deacetylase family protein [Candidatus Eisenbacteria bacterium]|nr:divergent polysaccharide deacetylase family protein [Candidatus Eisenbacteria bacterium]
MARKRKGWGLPGCLLAIVVLAGVAFLAGTFLVRAAFHRPEGSPSPSGRATPRSLLAAPLHAARGVAGRLGRLLPHDRDPAETSRRLSHAIREGLKAAGVPADSIADRVVEQGPAPLTWRVGVPPDRSLFQANYAVTRRVEADGGQVLSGREAPGPHGATLVTLLIGDHGHSTHELTLVRGPRAAKANEPQEPARLAVVVYGMSDDPALAKRFIDLPLPFSVALAPGPGTSPLFRAAHAAGREVILHLPLEPVNYPQVNPGPATLLVSLPPARITGLTRRYLDEAGPVVAVANLMGSLATQDQTAMAAVYAELRRRRLPFVHVEPVGGAVCRPLAAKMGVVYDQPGAVIDAETKPGRGKALERAWDEALKRARARGGMMVWIRASPETERWLPKALAVRRLQDVRLVPVSTVIRRPAEL